MKSKLHNLQSPKGMGDILPPDQLWWEKIRKEVQYAADRYHFGRIDTPLLERAEVFEKSLGEATDIVEKQMFVFKSRSGDRMVLRPEATAPIVRSYVQHGLSHLGLPLKLFYIGQMFRKEQPQAGRFRQFHQAGFEIISSDDDPIYDAQVIITIYRLLERLGVKDISLHINSIGCRICRPNYRKKLVEYYKDATAKLCKDCQRRLRENPLRLLDCKNDICQEYKSGAPIILNGVCSYCSKHLKSVLEYLEDSKVDYHLDNYLVRGLDYYNKTVFEFFTDAVNKEGNKFNFAIASGGRYDYLLEMFGARQSSGTGGAIGIERVIEVMKASGKVPSSRKKSGVFFISVGETAKKKSLSLIESLRNSGIDIVESLGKDSLAAQLRAADKEGSDYALIFGQKEVFEESIIIRDLKSGTQEVAPLKKLVNELKKRLK
ncbi:MAG: histidine--tRNA ligase [Candidatus Harrisonbacteria bacterium RIFCSPLOWO2_02_FULL_41_11]|uniref:Histidine--tRNA ligase n=1 Tax=Candidatus Harrisonbacteria bacterium RIFCSPHIGHO2_02_FULL_42_16 TaxID=1798404 RepID=A0A1G1ZI55_9BACT|nr:MAG: histidine--tRNA ligase [Candidatus Harrisonbacteria bacterium RIFCSPHIGHO2_02_FULL_42_16]OGY66626.1 MAG: histidine--tRNA ligase [Candidatus Harrisonbacteria bacterium RIFCSPLOWO2_02_FULL_41_11]